MQTHIHAVSERGKTLLRCDKCQQSQPLDSEAWQESLNTFVAGHYHIEPADAE